MNSKPEVAISGIGGIFPKCVNLDDFTDLLMQNKNTAEQAKWIENGQEDTLYNNFPDKRHEHFDASFFGVHSSQATYLDPITRLFIETTFEAIIDAGLNPADISGRSIPVMFASIMGESFAYISSDEKGPGFSITGQARCMTANRVSYYFNLNGPSYYLDQNWTSSIEVVEKAVDMIQNGLCEAAIVGGAVLSAGFSMQDLMEARGIICKDGKTKSFTEEADGYSRGDALVVLFLQRADDAKRNYASILYAHTRFNGQNDIGLTGFDLRLFEEFLQDCYNKSGVDPKDVSYLETDGCGIKHLDEMELAAVEEIFCSNRSTPLQIGSVKTNIGHTEAVSALSSLVKIIIAMETGILPAHLNFDLKDSKIPALINGKLEVVTRNKEWTGEIAAINNLGLSSTFGHMIVRRNNQGKPSSRTDLPFFMYYSTRTEEGAIEINRKVSEQTPDSSYMKLVQDVFSKTISGHLYRCYTVKTSVNKQGLQHFSGIKPPVWFVYSGMGSQWRTMGQDLMKIPVFARSIHKCHDILRSKGLDLLRIITFDDPQIFDNILNSFVGIAAIQIGLTDLLESIGVVADGLIGHSVGELGCAYADKCLTAEQMILCAYYRGRASLEAELITGMMAAVGMGYSAIRKICPDSIEVACHNSADNCTISGPVEDVKKFVEVLKSTGVFTRLVNVSDIAYHSKYVRPAAPLLLSYLEKVIPHPVGRSKKWICTSVPQDLWDTDLAKNVSPEYLTNNLLSSVFFEEGLPFIPDNAVLMEIAPHGLLQAILKRALSGGVVNIPLTRRETSSLEFLFNSLGQLYISGIDFNASHLYPDVPVPVPRGTRSLCSLVQWAHEYEWPTLIYTYRCGSWEKSVRINSDEILNFNNDMVDDKIIVPFSVFFGFIVDLMKKHSDVKMITIEDIIFQNQMEISPGDSTGVSIMYQPGSGHIELSTDKISILSGTVRTNRNLEVLPVIVEDQREISIITAHEFYKDLNMKGYDYPKVNKLVSKVTLLENGLKATIDYTKDICASLSSALQIHLFNRNMNQISPQILLLKYIRQIHVEFENLEDTVRDYSLYYSDVTRVIQSDCGIHISGIEYEEIKSNNIGVKIENLQFFAHSGEHVEDIKLGLNMVLKIIIENSYEGGLVIVGLEEKHRRKYLPYIETYFLKRNMIVEASEIDDITSEKIGKSLLTIISGLFLEDITQILPKVNGYVLLCFRSDQSISISTKYIIVAHFHSRIGKFYLIKQAILTPVEVINFEDEKLSFERMQTYPWTTELKTSGDDGKRIYVACRSLPAEKIDEFVRKMRSLSHETKVFRYLFLLDTGAPRCEPESEFYARIFEQDSIIQVLKDGSWGSFIDIAEFSEKTLNSNILSSFISSSDLLKICKPIYSGLHLNDLTRSNSSSLPNEVGALDFSGINENGQLVMGFGQFDMKQRSLTTDPEFLWPVPSGWTLSDAATVPYAFTLAYYSLFIVADLHLDDVVLIHGGTSEIGLAALYLATMSGYRVYTTIETDCQRTYLTNILEIPDENILDSCIIKYERNILLQTNGKGVQVILNCLPWKDNIEASKNLISRHGRIIQLATSTLKQYNTLGMFQFIKNYTFFGLSGQTLLQLPQDIKHKLREMMIGGIKNKHVQPLSRSKFKEYELHDGLRFLRSNSSIGAVLIRLDVNYNKFDGIKKPSSMIRSQGSYLIHADSSEAWLILTDWLVSNGAKRIVIASLSDPSSSFVERYIQIIQKTHNVEVIVSKYDAATSESTKKLLNIVGHLSLLNDTFIFAMSEDTDNYEKIVGNIHDSLYENKNQEKIIILIGRNREKYYKRASGLHICNIAWNSAYTIQNVIENLEKILNRNSTRVYLKNDSLQQLNETDQSSVKDYSSFLPSSLRTLKRLGHSDLESPEILKLSYNRKTQDDSSPLFIVPDLSGPHNPILRKFVDQVLYPVYCVLLPTSEIKGDIVKIIAEQIISTDSPKVYRLVGITWGAVLTLEIAKKLESLHKRVEVYLIDGAPQIIRNFTNSFYLNREFSFTLLKELIEINGESLENILSFSDLSKVDYKDIIRSLTVLKNHIQYSNSQKSIDNKIRGLVTVILPNSNCQENTTLAEHSEQFRYKVLKVDRRNILQSKSIIEYLHESIDIIFV